MTLTIKEGGYYRTRDGQKVGPLRHGPNRDKYPGDFWMAASLEGQPSWWEDGRVYITAETGGDLVAEWVDEPALPVRKVTRTEIVPGQYGVVGVLKEVRQTSYIRVWLPVDKPYLNAAELRDAAAVFLSLAEALEEQP